MPVYASSSQPATVTGDTILNMNPVTRWLKGKTGQGAYSAGRAHQEAGRFAQALVAFSDAERWLREGYGADHIWPAQAAVQRTWSLVHLGRADEGLPILERAIAQERKLRGDTARARMLAEHLAKARAHSKA
jgi:tetratricopeptide (TPR) repeat protein